MLTQLLFSLFLALLAFGAPVADAVEPEEAGFARLFDGKTLHGWKLVGQRGEGYGVKDGVIFCASGGGGNLLTEKAYSDFVLRFEFKLEPGANNGIAIRAPLAEGSAAYQGMEIQVLDDHIEKYGELLGTRSADLSNRPDRTPKSWQHSLVQEHLYP